MSKLNPKNSSETINPIKAINQLERLAYTFILGENTLYSSSKEVLQEIQELVSTCKSDEVYELILSVKREGLLRHTPLFLTNFLAKKLKDTKDILTDNRSIRTLLNEVITRPDMLTDFVALYWKDGRKMLPKQYKLAINDIFNKFNEYALAKYNRQNSVKLRDVLFMAHCKPKDANQARIFKDLTDNKLQTPDTWEVALSTGKDKKETFTRLIKEKQLGGLALVRNLRNMLDVDVGVDVDLIATYLSNNPLKGVLVHNIISAIRNISNEKIQNILFDKLKQSDFKLDGTTLLLVDISGSMDCRISDKSEVNRIDVAGGLALAIKSMTDRLFIFAFNDLPVFVDERKTDLALLNHFKNLAGGGTELGKSLSLSLSILENEYKIPIAEINRIIIITDEQSSDALPQIKAKINIMNVSCDLSAIPTHTNNVTRINGYSPHIVRFIKKMEDLNSKEVQNV